MRASDKLLVLLLGRTQVEWKDRLSAPESCPLPLIKAEASVSQMNAKFSLFKIKILTLLKSVYNGNEDHPRRGSRGVVKVLAVEASVFVVYASYKNF